MTLEEFEESVAAALDSLPDDVASLIENVDILVQDFPTRTQMRENRIRSRYGLLGLYEGVPLPDRGYGYGNVLPDRITIFRRPIEHNAASEESLVDEIRRTVIHEVGHYFGFGDEWLHSHGL